MCVVLRGSREVFTRGDMLRSSGEKVQYDVPQTRAHSVEFAGVFAKGRYQKPRAGACEGVLWL